MTKHLLPLLLIANISGNGGTVTGYSRPNLIGDPNSNCVVNGVTIPVGTINCFYNPSAFASKHSTS